MSYLKLDAYKEVVTDNTTASKVGVFFSIATPVAITAYLAVLLALFLTRPVVVTTTMENAFFTAPGIWLTCTCTNAR